MSTSGPAVPASPHATTPLVLDEAPLPRRQTAGPTLFAYDWNRPGTPARCVVALVHGFADYGKRYDHVARTWGERGIRVVAADLRGHGRAEGARGACRRFDEYLDDVDELLAVARARAAGSPLFLFGHSFGALVATARVLRGAAGVRALLVTGPNYGVAVRVPAWKRVAGRVASRVAPDFGLPSGLSGADLTHDPVIARAYDDDPLVFKDARARWYTEMNAGQARVMSGAGSLSVPYYVAMGTEDRVADLATAKAFFAAAGTADKTFDERKGLFHEVLNEPEWPTIASRMADWMLARA